MKIEDPNVLIGGRIRKAREEEKLSQADLARGLDYESATAISLIEAGERKLRAEDLQKVASLLHRDVKYFLGQENETATVKVALRAENLTGKEQQEVLNFIEFVKQKKNRNRDSKA